MKLARAFFSLALIAWASSCATEKRPRGAKIEQEPMLISREVTLVAGEKNPLGPPLVRVLRNGNCIFTAMGEQPFEVEAAPGEQIPEGDSDFFGMVVSSNNKRQTAKVRVFDLDSPLPPATQAASTFGN